MSRSKSVARFTRSELLEMSVRELKELLPAGDQYKPTDNRDLCDYLIESGAVDLVVEEPSLIQSGVVDLGGNLVPSVDQYPSVVQSNSVDQSHLVDQLPSADQSPSVVEFVGVDRYSSVEVLLLLMLLLKLLLLLLLLLLEFFDADQYSPVASPSLEDRDNDSIPERQYSSEEAQEWKSDVSDSHLCPESQRTRTSNSRLTTTTETEEQPDDFNTPDTSMDTTATDDEDDDDGDDPMFHLRAEEAKRSSGEGKFFMTEEEERISISLEENVLLRELQDLLSKGQIPQRISTPQPQPVKSVESSAPQEQEETKMELARLRAEEATWIEARAKLEKERDEIKEDNKRLSRSYDDFKLQSEQRATQNIWELACLHAEEAKWTKARTQLEKERDALEESKKELARLRSEEAKWALAALGKERDELKETKEELACLRAEVAKWTEAHAALGKERKETKEELARLRAEEAKWTAARTQLEKERDALEESNKGLSRSYGDFRLRVEQLATQRNSELARLRAKEAKWTEERTQLEKERGKFKETKKELAHHLRAKEAKWTEEHAELTKERDGLKETNKKWALLESDVVKLIEAVSKLTKERDDLKETNKRLSPCYVVLRDQHVFRIGDRAVITNNLRREQGITGTVTRVSETKVTIEDDDFGLVYTRDFHDMCKIPRRL